MSGGGLATRSALRRELARAERPLRWRAFLLAAPALAFLLIVFVLPMAALLQRAVDNAELGRILPRTFAALDGWDGRSAPGEAVFRALAEDLRVAQAERSTAQAGKRLNYELPGMRSRMLAAARLATASGDDAFRTALLAQDPAWGEPAVWAVIARNADRYTPYYLLTALDLQRLPDGSIARASPDQAIFLPVLGRTLWVAAVVTAATLLLGYPVAHVIAVAPPRLAQLLLLLVLLPLWTSLLVRTTAWVVLLQSNGVINDLLLGLQLTSQRLQLLFSRTGTLVAMTHIQLPFTILPILAAMRGIPADQLRAARSLGAPPLAAYWRIYVPQTLPGIAAGTSLTFILALGYYLTPALVGGPSDQMVGNFIAQFINRDLNWGLAAALGSVLLVVTLGLYRLQLRLLGPARLGLG